MLTYNYGDDFEVFLAEARKVIQNNELLSMVLEPGDCTRYNVLISKVIFYIGAPANYVISYVHDKTSFCVNLGPNVSFVHPSYLLSKADYVNQHTICFICEIVNRIFECGKPNICYDIENSRVA